MFNGINMNSMHYILKEVEENRAVIFLKKDINDSRSEQGECAIILSIRNSTYRDKEILYQDMLRIYEKHNCRIVRNENRNKK